MSTVEQSAKGAFHNAARCLLLLGLLPLFQWSAAAPGDHSSVSPRDSSTAGAPPTAAEPPHTSGPGTVAELVAAFDSAYRPPAFEQESYFAAEAALNAAEQLLLPRATFKEGLGWDDYSALALEFGLDLAVPLHSSVAALHSELAAINLESRHLALEVARADATASLLVETANLAALGWARTLVTDALTVFAGRARSWRDATLANNGYVPPEERQAFEHYLKLRDAATWFGQQIAATELRLGRSLELSADELFIPPLFAVEEFLAAIATPLPEVAECLASSAHSEQALLRSRSGTLDDELRSGSEFTIALNADLGYAFPSWSTSGPVGSPSGTPLSANGSGATPGVNAALALEARILVPDGWPLAGSTAVIVSPEHAEQSVELSWPPLPTPQRVVSDRAAALDDELQDLQAELLALRSAWSQAVSDRELLERRLTWVILDAEPDLTAESVSSLLQAATQRPNLNYLERPAGGSARSPEAALTSVEIRVQHVFARVAEVSARASYLAACGWL